MSNFRQRAISAVVFVSVMLLGLFFNETSFMLLFALAAFGCLWEFVGLTLDGNEKRLLKQIIALIIAVPIYFWNWFFSGYQIIPLETDFLRINFESDFLVKLFTPAFFGILVLELFLKSAKPFSNVSHILFGIFYTVLPFCLLGTIAVSPIEVPPQYSSTLRFSFSPNVVAGMVFLTWANDTGAYIFGSKLGKTLFFPRISPKKTWEGTIGGVLMCMLMGFVISHFFKEISLVDWIVVGAIVAIFGTLGDLVESMLKRSVGVKDSGSILPGHGGFLDRFDAFLFAIPFVFFYLSFVQ